MVTDDPPTGVSRLDWIMETRATYVLGVPTHAMDVLSEQKRRGTARIGVVKTFYMAGSPIPREVANQERIKSIKDPTAKYMEYLRIMSKPAVSDIVIPIPPRGPAWKRR